APAIWCDCQMDAGTATLLLRVSNELRVGIFLGADRDVAVQLIDRLGLGQSAQHGDQAWVAPLPWAVVDDRDSGLDGLDHDRVIADGQSMMGRLVHIDQADLVGGMNELVLDVPGQIPQIEEAEAAIGKEETKTSCIIG